MRIKEIINEEDARLFLEVPVALYRNDPEWIRPLDKDINDVFDPAINKFFRHGEAVRWLLLDDQDQAVGRVAAFINKRTSSREKQPTGGMGFFECRNNQEEANLLFDTCKKWLQDRGMQAMDGPINFGERDRWWGLLVKGFYAPVYCMNYNPEYYIRLFENYGFKEYFQQLCFSLTVDAVIDPKFENAYEKLKNSGDYHAEHITKGKLEKYARDFSEIYNKAWSKFGGGKDISPEQAIQLFKKMKPVIDENLVWFAYYKKHEPVGLWLNLPELNQFFKHFNGKLGLIEKLRFLWMKSTWKKLKFYGLVFGVVPEHQGKGVDGLMICAGQRHLIKQNRYYHLELQWIGDFNPKMIAIARSLGTQQSRTLVTYRKLFDETAPFERMKSL
jgi:hypothetical protein